MRLTAFLAFGKKPIGFKYRGKNRVVKEIKPYELKALRKDYERTEMNMMWLRHPYLTVEQSYGHMSHFNRTKEFFIECARLRNEKFAKHVTIAERLEHLKVSEKWD
ncbi:large ribosomal subunit protein mL63 [Phymastichus coffea]|uniref:large ribosomal subunit protein mL63 n=1 Tax=Phymastichus coffea TaxID=108790 RepID=UPI00273BAC01|nr:large ribosomal subunit protein mL63 [Phymastichus coffea]